MVTTQPVSKEEAKWRAEDDARTLAYAAQIMEDKARLKKAKVAAQRMAKEEDDRAKAMRKVARVKTNGKTEKKSSPSKSKKSTNRQNTTPYNVFQRLK